LGGALFVTNGGNDSVSEFSVTLTGVVTTVNLPVGSHPVAITSTAGAVMYVLNSGPNTVCPSTGSISTLSTATLTVNSTVCVGVNPIAMVQVPGGGRIFEINQGDNSVWVFDPSSQQVVAEFTTAAGLGLNPVFLAASADGAYVFVVTQGDGINP